MSLETQIAEAKAALHDLATGKAVRVVVDQNGERIEFSPANTARLRAYIADLESQASTSGATRGPMGIIL